jgi:carbon storage regulator
MLTLSRRTRETIRIGKNIRLTILKITSNSVRVGIRAPRNVPVDREEVFLRKRNSCIKPDSLQKERADFLGEVDVCAAAIADELLALADEHTSLAVLVALAWHASAAWKLMMVAPDTAADRSAFVLAALENLEVDPAFLRGWPVEDLRSGGPSQIET